MFKCFFNIFRCYDFVKCWHHYLNIFLAILSIVQEDHSYCSKRTITLYCSFTILIKYKTYVLCIQIIRKSKPIYSYHVNYIYKTCSFYSPTLLFTKYIEFYLSILFNVPKDFEVNQI